MTNSTSKHHIHNKLIKKHTDRRTMLHIYFVNIRPEIRCHLLTNPNKDND